MQDERFSLTRDEKTPRDAYSRVQSPWQTLYLPCFIEADAENKQYIIKCQCEDCDEHVIVDWDPKMEADTENTISKNTLMAVIQALDTHGFILKINASSLTNGPHIIRCPKHSNKCGYCGAVVDELYTIKEEAERDQCEHPHQYCENCMMDRVMLAKSISRGGGSIGVRGVAPKEFIDMEHPSIEDYMEKVATRYFPTDTALRYYHSDEHTTFKQLGLRMPDEHPYLYFGVEIELLFAGAEGEWNDEEWEEGNDYCEEQRYKIVEDLLEAADGLFVAEMDRSITEQGCGAEFISRPLSYKKWTDAETIERLENFFDKAREHGVYTTDGCGLHIHTSKRFYEAKGNRTVGQVKGDMDWMFQIFQPQIEKLSRRNYTEYCASKAQRLQQALRNTVFDMNVEIGSALIKKGEHPTISQGSGVTHHDAIIETRCTLETRTFKSVTNVTQLLASIEIVRAFSHAARTMDIGTNTTFGDILHYKSTKYLDEYLTGIDGLDENAKWVETLEVKYNG